MTTTTASLRCGSPFEERNVERLVVRPRNGSHQPDFTELGAFVVNLGSAVEALLERAVAAPQSAALPTSRDPDGVVAQVEVVNDELRNVPVRDLSVPPDVLLMEVLADSSVVVNGHTALQPGVQVTVIITADSLEEVYARLG